MAKRRDSRDDHRESHRSRLKWIVAMLVVAVAGSCALSSYEDKHGSGMFPALELPELSFVRDFIDEMVITDSGEMENAVAVTAPLPDAELEVHILDVGQGDSILIKAPGANVLIDAGENDQGAKVVRYLEAQKIKTLDYVIGTHPHSDHIGGLDTVIKAMSVEAVLLPVLENDLTPTTQTYMDLLDAIEEKELRITAAKSGKTLDLGDGAVLRILGPIGEYADLNNMSVVSKLTYGTTAFLFTGDLSEGAENDLLTSGVSLRANVLDVGHHGSNTSTTAAFLDAVSPRVATISCGLDNSYGHPHREVMERLEERNIRILRTDLNGVMVVSSDGERIGVASEN